MINPKYILIFFVLLGVVWGLFYCPPFMDKPHSAFWQKLDQTAHWYKTGNFFVRLLKLILMLLVLIFSGIIWVILWLAQLIELQYILFGAGYLGLFGLLFISLLNLFLKLFMVLRHENLWDY